MEILFAPLEGITGALFRRVHHTVFGGVDAYYMPFVAPTQNHVFSRRDLRQIAPEENEGVPAIPQLLTKNAEDFLWAAEELAAMGYSEVNLNLGCPSGTVTAKGKGAGFLAAPWDLEIFLDAIFEKSPLPISIKTRIGMSDPEEFPDLLEIFSRYPISLLTVHPRIREDFYKYPLRPQSFQLAYDTYQGPLCYNGGIRTAEGISALTEKWPNLKAVMPGRGLLGDPALGRRAKGGGSATREELRRFHDGLYEAYCEAFQSKRDAIYHMKEVWMYLSGLFAQGEAFQKKLRKVTDDGAYRELVGRLFAESALLETPRETF